jgi:hypothetical protein
MKKEALILIAVIIGFWFFFIKNKGSISQPLAGYSPISGLPGTGTSVTKPKKDKLGNALDGYSRLKAKLGNTVGKIVGIENLGDKVEKPLNLARKWIAGKIRGIVIFVKRLLKLNLFGENPNLISEGNTSTGLSILDLIIGGQNSFEKPTLAKITEAIDYDLKYNRINCTRQDAISFATFLLDQGNYTTSEIINAIENNFKP